MLNIGRWMNVLSQVSLWMVGRRQRAREAAGPLCP